MDIKEYRYIYEIARHGSISRAASELHISQPSLSVYLKNVEGRLGIALFDTSAGSARPTPAGEVYLEHARQIIGIDSALMETLDGIKRRQVGSVRIGITGARSKYLSPGILQACRERHPGIEIRLIEATSAELEAMVLHQRSLDLVLINEPLRSSGLETTLLFQEQVLLAVPRRLLPEGCTALEESGRWPAVDLTALQDVPFTLLMPGQQLRKMADALFLESGIQPRVLLETHRMGTASAMAERGFSACFLYDSLLPQIDISNLAVFQVGIHPICLPFQVAYQKDALQFPPVAAVLETLTKYIQSEIEARRRLRAADSK